LKNLYNAFFKARFSWLIPIAMMLAFNFSTLFWDRFLGDNDGIISGHSKFIAFDVNILLCVYLIFTLYYKNIRVNDIHVSNIAWYLLIPLAFILRIILANLGHNYDVESFEIVANIVLKGESVYACTERYNYGPVWAYTLAGIQFITNSFQLGTKGFHFGIVTVLFVFELIFYKALYKNYKNNLSILLLLFNPISLVIIGHHSQFDIIALCLAYLSYIQIKNNNIVKAVLLLGISYSVKHIMVFFPLLLIFDKDIQLKNRLLYLIIPSILFVISFLPFHKDLEAINKNVLTYQLNNGQTFLKQFFDLIIPNFVIHMGVFKILPIFTEYKMLWLALFPIVGYLASQYQIKNTFFLYLILIVGTSLAISEQYFLIPLTGIFFYRKRLLSWVFTICASYYILFVSFHNTSRYFGLKDLGLNLDFEWYQLSFSKIQLCLILLLIQILYQARKVKKESKAIL
jgi:hypothetical protein